MKNKKTLWQKIYSALGFWSYYKVLIDEDGNTIDKKKVFYWICLPYGKYFRKFDLFSIKVKTDTV